MSTDQTWQTVSRSSEDTSKIGESIGKKLKGGEVLVCVGDVGSGKTTFIKGVAKGMGSNDITGSPSFTIERVYKGRDRLEVHHFDFYRLHHPGVVAQELAETLSDPDAVVAIEWGEIVQNILPEGKAVINFSAIGEDARQIKVDVSPVFAYLLKELPS